MRLFAALAFLALSAFWGYAKAYALSARAAALTAFVEEVPRLLLRMDYEARPLSLLAAKMAERGGVLSPFWKDFGAGLDMLGAEAAWQNALSKSPPYGLAREDAALLQGVGSALAAPDGASRQQAVSGLLQEAARQRDILRADMERKGNLYGTLGLLLGLGAAILII